MPVTKANRRRYPAHWKALARAVKDAAGWRCVGSPAYPACRAAHGEPHPVTGSRVVITTAHLDHTPENCTPENLRAWCQRCHLRYDQEHHATNVRATAAKKRAKRLASRARAAKSDAIKRARVMAGRETFNAWVMGAPFTPLAPYRLKGQAPGAFVVEVRRPAWPPRVIVHPSARVTPPC